MTSDKEKKSTCKKPQRPQIPYKKLKQTQKARISRWMFEAVCKYYKEHQQMPPEECLESMCRERRVIMLLFGCHRDFPSVREHVLRPLRREARPDQPPSAAGG